MTVELSFDGLSYPLAEGQEAQLAKELRDYAQGRSPERVAEVIRGEVGGIHWTDGAGELAERIEAAAASGGEQAVVIEGKAIETLRAALGPIADGGDPEGGPGAGELLADLRALDCKVCWGLGWTPVFAVAGSGAQTDEWRRCKRCLGTGRRDTEGEERPVPSEPPLRHRAS